MKTADVVVIGGGIMGASAAAYLAEAGRSVVLLERAELAAGASGRNSGAVQHPFDGPFADLHLESLKLYRELDPAAGFELAAHPTGLMLLSTDEAAVARVASALARDWPELHAQVLPEGEPAGLEPALARELAACRLETGYPVAPATATNAFAWRARAAGAEIRINSTAVPAIVDGRVTGATLADGGEQIAAGQVLVAAGPWSNSLVPGWAERPPIRSVWGVVVSTTIVEAPRHVLEELGIGSVSAMEGRLFSLVTVGPTSSVGSSFIEEEPDSPPLAAQIVERGARFVPAIGSAPIDSIRACARPAAFDGRPLIGAVPGFTGLFVCAGHGPWGISTGPASARLVVDQMLGVAAEKQEFSPSRWPINTEFA